MAKRLSGFAAMDPEKRRAIAKMGGASVPKEARSFFADRALAISSGRKGGQSIPAEARSFSQDRALAVSAGKKGAANLAAKARSASKSSE